MDHNGLGILAFQGVFHAVFSVCFPGVISALNGQGYLPAFLQKSQVESPVHQVFGHFAALSAGKIISLDQVGAIAVQAFQRQHPVGAAQGHFHLGVNGHLQGAVGGIVGLVIAEEHQAGAGCCPGQAADSGEVYRQNAGTAQQNGLFHLLAHGIPKVGRLEKPPLLVQQDGIGRMKFHNQIFHTLSPPFSGDLRGAIWHRCPRMIS